MTLGAKPKQSQRQKLDNLLASNRVPSTLAAAFFRHARRWLAGESPGEPARDRGLRAVLRMPTQRQALLSCAVKNADALPSADRDRLLDPAIFGGCGRARRDVAAGRPPSGVELSRRAKDALFGDPDAPERPGQGPDLQRAARRGELRYPRCASAAVNDLRTFNFQPPLNPGDFLPTRSSSSTARRSSSTVSRS